MPKQPQPDYSKTKKTLETPLSHTTENQPATNTQLLKEHITIAVDLIAAAKTGDQKKFAEADAKWTTNANQIAAFLSKANPNWPEKDVTDLLSLHLKITKEEVVARLNKNWDEDIKKFDEIFTEIMVLADALSEGIVKQFPDKFKS